MPNTFPKSHHLRNGADFRRVYDSGRSASDATLVVYALANDLPHPRLGLSVSRKVGNAVARNRWKRLLREAFRLSRDELPSGHDLVLIPRRPKPPPLAELCQNLPHLAARAARKR